MINIDDPRGAAGRAVRQAGAVSLTTVSLSGPARLPGAGVRGGPGRPEHRAGPRLSGAAGRVQPRHCPATSTSERAHRAGHDRRRSAGDLAGRGRRAWPRRRCRAGCSGCRSGPRRRRCYVDFAHTPQAVTAALEAHWARAAGSRCSAAAATATRSKRGPMGGRGAQNADLVVVTDDNPRSEDAGGDPGARCWPALGEPIRATGSASRWSTAAIGGRPSGTALRTGRDRVMSSPSSARATRPGQEIAGEVQPVRRRDRGRRGMARRCIRRPADDRPVGRRDRRRCSAPR